jgi:hypothetical protein
MPLPDGLGVVNLHDPEYRPTEITWWSKWIPYMVTGPKIWVEVLEQYITIVTQCPRTYAAFLWPFLAAFAPRDPLDLRPCGPQKMHARGQSDPDDRLAQH